MKKEYDYLLVGAGLFNAVFAQQAKIHGKRCLVIDKRPHPGGNVYCEDIDGITMHKYGPHIFHTSNKEVWDYVNSFVPFNRFTLNTLAYYKGRIFNLPFNMNTFHQMWGVVGPVQVETVRPPSGTHQSPEPAQLLLHPLQRHQHLHLRLHPLRQNNHDESHV